MHAYPAGALGPEGRGGWKGAVKSSQVRQECDKEVVEGFPGHTVDRNPLERVWRKGNTLALLVGM